MLPNEKTSCPGLICSYLAGRSFVQRSPTLCRRLNRLNSLSPPLLALGTTTVRGSRWGQRRRTNAEVNLTWTHDDIEIR